MTQTANDISLEYFEGFIKELGFKDSSTGSSNNGSLDIHAYYKLMNDGRIYCLEYNIYNAVFRSAFHKDMGDFLSDGWSKLKFTHWIEFDETVMMVDGLLIDGFGERGKTQAIDTQGSVSGIQKSIIRYYDWVGDTFTYEISNADPNNKKDVYFLFPDDDKINHGIHLDRPKTYPKARLEKVVMKTGGNREQFSNDITIMDLNAYIYETTGKYKGGGMARMDILPSNWLNPNDFIPKADIQSLHKKELGTFVLKTTLEKAGRIVLDLKISEIRS